MFRVLGIITARGGSKGIPRKNIRLLAGKPLLQYTAEAALGAKRLSRVILSTEDAEIAEVGRSCGIDVPFMRPLELAQDDTPTLPVVQHAVRSLHERGAIYDAVCLLQPTSPLRQAADIDGCITSMVESGADCVVTVLRVPDKYNPHWVYFRNKEGFLQLSTDQPEPIPRRQALPVAVHREGSVYVTRRSILMEGNSLYGTKVLGYQIKSLSSLNIDTQDDWEAAEQLFV